MSLTLKFHGSSPDQQGYIIIDGPKMIIGFSSKDKRDVFAGCLSEFVYPYIKDPSIKSCIIKEDHTRNVVLKNQHDIDAYKDYIFLTFKNEIDFKSLWILLTHVPSSKLDPLIAPSCVRAMLTVAMEYFMDIFDETAEVKEKQPDDEGLPLSNSPTISGLHLFASAKHEKNEASQGSTQQPSRKSKVFFFHHQNNEVLKDHENDRKAATGIVSAAMSKDEEFRREFYSNGIG